MDTDFPLADNAHRLGEYATHPRVRPDKRLAVSLLLAGPRGPAARPQGAGRGCRAAEAATAPLSSLRARHSPERTIKRVQLLFLG